MAWPTLTIQDWEHFLKISSHVAFGPAATTAYAFRGQANAIWPLAPSLLRHMKPNITSEIAIDIEKDALREFQSQAHLHVPPSILMSASGLLSWYSLMQHHGAPTRLLDWTESIFVAAYFAVEQCWDCDGVIWLVHLSTLAKQMVTRWRQVNIDTEQMWRDNLLNPQAFPILLPWFPDRKSDRMVAQQGLFTLCFQVLGNHEVIVDDACHNAHDDGGGETYRKLLIPKSLKPEFLRKLRSMNITAYCLFPGVDGLGRSITELTRLSAHFPKL